ncbi:biotin-[acetyl-CoA-carboxylase] ligase [Pandoraea thiooxydans]|uniref:biotin--[biotin carboxyl-carrier protein] ligase n=1 Tax=Pandoraea thiooxydans TaxID=445709 RepID=A0A0G3ETC4_9BURK|nr:biotin--[acetyl-CoA-carboxylase] ligase [Pandoraea thiooxydans]AKJ69279.1 biotin--[acetyl-CoA-carboxylase] ligase [Pandoraea thiooxydans]APR96889.1 biotin-[acetyl-CoA-carboxylase] ligase [Pandoraea thiooxydans]
MKTPFSDSSPGAGDQAPARQIDRARLAALTSRAVTGWDIELVETTGSTNTDLLNRWRNASPGKPTMRLAYRQEAGRGQRGRVWRGMPGDSLMFSVACGLPLTLPQLAGLSLATGVAVIEGLQRLPLSAPQALTLKWPNDVLLAGRKLAGILIEANGAEAGRTTVVIGIGLNLRHTQALDAQLAADQAEQPQALAAARPAALEEILSQVDMTHTLAVLLDQLEQMLTRFAVDGFAAFRPAWEALHGFAGQPVRLVQPGMADTEGIALGVDDSGCLRLGTADGVQLVTSGQVSLRPRERA